MNTHDVKPGHGYVVYEKLGSGRWKEVYRGVRRGEWHDKALVRFVCTPSRKQLLDELVPFVKLNQQAYPKNVVRLYDSFEGDDGHIYMVEELLSKPLDKAIPIANGTRFMGFARDLYTGLAELHKRDKIHRDLKLENCGIDYAGYAKIFDLGLLTSEGSQVDGSMLTRAPELFLDESQGATKASDVWALGATLFALRTGDYPFITKDKWRDRPQQGDDEKRREIDANIKGAALAWDAEQKIQGRLEKIFPSGPCKLMTKLLAFNPDTRPRAEEIKDWWDEQITEWIRIPSEPVQNQDDAMAQYIMSYLRGAIEGTVGMSARQYEKIAVQIDQLDQRMNGNQSDQLRALQTEFNNQRTKNANE